jgi:hypothetical protein
VVTPTIILVTAPGEVGDAYEGLPVAMPIVTIEKVDAAPERSATKAAAPESVPPPPPRAMEVVLI